MHNCRSLSCLSGFCGSSRRPIHPEIPSTTSQTAQARQPPHSPAEEPAPQPHITPSVRPHTPASSPPQRPASVLYARSHISTLSCLLDDVLQWLRLHLRQPGKESLSTFSQCRECSEVRVCAQCRLGLTGTLLLGGRLFVPGHTCSCSLVFLEI